MAGRREPKDGAVVVYIDAPDGPELTRVWKNTDNLFAGDYAGDAWFDFCHGTVRRQVLRIENGA